MDLTRVHDEVIVSLLKNYRSNLLFRLFLYPYIGQTTLLATKRISIFYSIYSYVKDIVDSLPQNLEKLNSLNYETDDKGHIIDSLFIWPKSHVVYDLKFDEDAIRKYLLNTHSWDWISQSEISPEYGNNIIKIKNPQEPYIVSDIYIDTKLGKATLRQNGKVIDSFVIAANKTLVEADLFLVVGKKTIQKTADFLLQKLILSYKSNIQSFLLNIRDEMNTDEATNGLFRQDKNLMESMKSLNIL